MRQFTADEIQAQFEKLPAEVQAAVTSTEVNDKIEALAKKHNLLIDQTGELVDEIGLVMLGLNKSNDFVDHIITRCSINRKDAVGIAEDVNAEVFSTIRKHMREIEEKNNLNTPEFNRETDISNLERIGDFEILKEGDNGNSSNNEPTNVENIETDNLLASPAVMVEGKIVPEAPSNLPTENSSSEPPMKPQTPPSVTSIPANSTSPTPLPKKAYANDPYHEPIG